MSEETLVHAVDLDAIFDSDTVEIEDSNPLASAKESLDSALDELNKELSVEDLVKAQASLYLESGDYRFVSTPNLNVSFYDKNKEQGDVSSKGRTMVNISGTVQSSERTGNFRFTFSPDYRIAKDKDGNIRQPQQEDIFYQTWAKITESFFKRHERQPKSVNEVVQWLLKPGYEMYISKSKNGGNFLGQIKPL